MTFAGENFKVRNWVVIYQKTILIIEKSERAKKIFWKFFWWFYCLNDILSEKVRIVKVRKTAKIRNRYNQVPHLTKDTTWESSKTTITSQTRAKRSALSEQVTTMQQWTDAKAWQSQHINNTNDPQKKYRLERVSKNILLEGWTGFTAPASPLVKMWIKKHRFWFAWKTPNLSMHHLQEHINQYIKKR